MSIVAQVLLNSVVNSVNKESIAYILLQLWWLLVSWWARSLSTGLVISISKNFTSFFRKAFHQTRWHLLCSSQLNFLLMRYHCLGNIDKTRGSQFDLKRPSHNHHCARWFLTTISRCGWEYRQRFSRQHVITLITHWKNRFIWRRYQLW